MNVIAPSSRLDATSAAVRVGTVGAFVLTFRRPAVLASTLKGVLEQTRRVDQVTVLNCDTAEPLAPALEREFPGVAVIDLEANVGSAGGFSRALRLAYQQGLDWGWLLDDDSVPRPDALVELMRAAEAARTGAGLVGIMAPVQVSPRHVYGVSVWRNRLIRVPVRRADPPVDVDVAYWAGMLVSRHVLDEIGYPRAEFFRCFGDYEFCLRARRAGFRVVAVPTSHIAHDHGRPNVVIRLGRPSIRLRYPPSRFYYHVRNVAFTTRFVLRSPKAMAWHVILQFRHAAGDLFYADRRWERVRLRFHGLLDGFRGRLGRRADLEA